MKSNRKNAMSKLRSERGASMMFALLVMLVCLLVAAVVITAATAAVGRFSRLAEMDQRFYSVSSATEVFSRLLDGQTVSVVREQKVTVTETATYEPGDDGVVCSERTRDRTASYAARFGDGSALGYGQSFSKNAALDLLFGDVVTYATQTGYESAYPAFSDDMEKTVSISHSVTDGDLSADALALDAKAVLKPDGTVVITLTDNGYQVEMIFSAEVTERSTESNETGKPVIEHDPDTDIYMETITTTTTQTKTAEFRWTLTDVKKVYGA